MSAKYEDVNKVCWIRECPIENGNEDTGIYIAEQHNFANGKAKKVDPDLHLRWEWWYYLQPGDVEITRGGKLPCKFVVHAVGPRWPNHSLLTF